MNGDLSVALQPTLPDLTPSAVRTVLPAGASRARTGAEREPDVQHPAAAGQLEARRLKALLTDPAMQVSTHHDDASGHVVLRVHDQATGELIDQFPTEELLRLYAALRETLVDERV